MLLYEHDSGTLSSFIQATASYNVNAADRKTPSTIYQLEVPVSKRCLCHQKSISASQREILQNAVHLRESHGQGIIILDAIILQSTSFLKSLPIFTVALHITSYVYPLQSQLPHPHPKIQYGTLGKDITLQYYRLFSSVLPKLHIRLFQLNVLILLRAG